MYLNATDGYTCVACAKGTYQPNTQQTACLKCPQDTSTQDVGKSESTIGIIGILFENLRQLVWYGGKSLR